MSYDSKVFEEELDQAIAGMAEIFDRWLDSDDRLAINPKLEPSMSTSDAMARTCMALIMRVLPKADIAQRFVSLMSETRAMLVSKNKNYGDSALSPMRIFSTASAREQLLVRLDDKASRMARGASAGEDPARDALGYFLLLLIAERRQKVVIDRR